MSEQLDTTTLPLPPPVAVSRSPLSIFVFRDGRVYFTSVPTGIFRSSFSFSVLFSIFSFFLFFFFFFFLLFAHHHSSAIFISYFSVDGLASISPFPRDNFPLEIASSFKHTGCVVHNDTHLRVVVPTGNII